MVLRGDLEEARLLQNEAIAEGTIDKSTNYVREFGKPVLLSNAAEALENGARRDTVERELIEDMFGSYEGASTDQRNNVRKELAVVTTFGADNADVTAILKADTNLERVTLLADLRREMGETDFRRFYQMGRETMTLESGNPSPILISDDLDQLFFEYWLKNK
jgi:hypothetical protein